MTRQFPYTPPKLADGLRPFLDDRRKRRRHHDHGYDDFVSQLEEIDVSIRELMEYMDVRSYKTIKAWISKYEEEKKNV